jgi:hypothetical protein
LEPRGSSLVLDGVYQLGTDGETVFVEVPALTDEALQAVLHNFITRTMSGSPVVGADRRAGPNVHGRQRVQFGKGSRAQASAG